MTITSLMRNYQVTAEQKIILLNIKIGACVTENERKKVSHLLNEQENTKKDR